ncbi:MAG: hypothetical protein HKM94_08975, partial [Halobacteria archaeon]|nr:hypothetical protein [Halobacteria archaeon]
FLQFISSLVVIGLLAKWVLAPWLAKLSHRDALFWLTVPHAFRYLGMVFLVPGVVAQPLPDAFAIPAAYGDLLPGILALVALIALRTGLKGAIGAVWLFNVVGTVDLLNALRHVEVAPLFGAAWYIPTMLVPLLLVTHVMIFARLLKPVTKPE